MSEETSDLDLHNRIVELWSTDSDSIRKLLNLPTDTFTKIESHSKKPTLTKPLTRAFVKIENFFKKLHLPKPLLNLLSKIPQCIIRVKDYVSVFIAGFINKGHYSDIETFTINSTKINISTHGLTEQKARILESLAYISLKSSDPDKVYQLINDERRKHFKYKIKITITKSN